MTVLFILNTLLLTYNFYKAWHTDPGFLKSNREDKVKVSAAYRQRDGFLSHRFVCSCGRTGGEVLLLLEREAEQSEDKLQLLSVRWLSVGSGSLSSPMREHRNFAQFYCISVTNFSTVSECILLEII